MNDDASRRGCSLETYRNSLILHDGFSCFGSLRFLQLPVVRYQLPIPLIDRNRNPKSHPLRTPRFPPPLRSSALNPRHPPVSVSPLHERRRQSARVLSLETYRNSLILHDGLSCFGSLRFLQLPVVRYRLFSRRRRRSLAPIPPLLPAPALDESPGLQLASLFTGSPTPSRTPHFPPPLRASALNSQSRPPPSSRFRNHPQVSSLYKRRRQPARVLSGNLPQLIDSARWLSPLPPTSRGPISAVYSVDRQKPEPQIALSENFALSSASPFLRVKLTASHPFQFPRSMNDDVSRRGCSPLHTARKKSEDRRCPSRPFHLCLNLGF